MPTYGLSEVEWVWGNYFSWFNFYYLFDPSNELLALYTSNDRRLDLWMPYNMVYKKEVNASANTPSNTIRISEAYLNRAEARILSATPDLTGALSDLNELKRHRITGYQDMTSTDNLLTEVRNERRRELCFDWHRWFDLRRYGMPAITHDYRASNEDPLMTYTLRENDPLYTLPFPTSAIEHNMSLQQNPSASEPRRSGVPAN